MANQHHLDIIMQGVDTWNKWADEHIDIKPVGLMVTGNTYRHPAVLAKMAATVDIIAHGRLNFGIGTGWSE